MHVSGTSARRFARYSSISSASSASRLTTMRPGAGAVRPSGATGPSGPLAPSAPDANLGVFALPFPQDSAPIKGNPAYPPSASPCRRNSA